MSAVDSMEQIPDTTRSGDHREGVVPRVTVGLPVYNGEHHIERALEGILRQTHRDFVLLISDNDSTDDTWSVVQRWAERDDRIRIYRQPTNIGLKRNFGFLLEQAQTEYFMWHADDDYIAPNYLEALLELFDREPACDLASPYGVRVSAEGAVLHEEAFPALDPHSKLRRIRTLLAKPQITSFYALFRTRVLREVFELSERFPHVWASDAIGLLPLVLNDRMRGTDDTTFYYVPNRASLEEFRPRGFFPMARFLFDYTRFHFLIAHRSQLGPIETVVVLPWLLNHVIVSLFERPYRRFFKHPIKRVLRRLGLWPAKKARAG